MPDTIQSNSTADTPLHFARFEFKYLLPASKRKAVEDDLLYFLQFDPFVENLPEHRYPVRSLYFDTPDFSAYHDKEDGLHSRSKFRLRTYTTESDQAAPVFLEIKGRHNNLVFKHRTPVSTTDLNKDQLSGYQIAEIILQHTEPSPIRSQFEYDYFRKRLQPVALIDYKRRPYLSKYDSSFRLTFDEDLKAKKTDSLFPFTSNAEAREILPGYTVLEVKFRHHLPSWFHRVIQTHELKRISISKICSGMRTLEMVNQED